MITEEHTMGILEFLGDLVGSEESKKRQAIRDTDQKKRLEIQKTTKEKEIRQKPEYQSAYERYLQYCFDNKEDIPNELLTIENEIKELKEELPGVDTTSRSLALNDIKKEYAQDTKAFAKKLEEKFNISEDKKDEIRKTAGYIGHYDRYVSRIYKSGHFNNEEIREMSKELSGQGADTLKESSVDYQAKRIALNDINNDAQKDINRPLLKTKEGYNSMLRYTDRLLKTKNKKSTETVFLNIKNELDNLESENGHGPKIATRLRVLNELDTIYQEEEKNKKPNFTSVFKKVNTDNKNQLDKLEEYKIQSERSARNIVNNPHGNAKNKLSQNAQPINETIDYIGADNSKSK